MALKLKNDLGNLRIYEVDKNLVAIELDESGDNISVYETVWDNDEEVYEEIARIGNFTLEELDDGSYYIQFMDLTGCGGRYRHIGLGREALKFFKDYFDTKLYAATNDGQTRSDGSHLTGDGLPFVSRLREQGVIERDSNGEDEDE